MNDHHKRINERLLQAITECQAGKLRLEDLENTIAYQLAAVDASYPIHLKQKLDGFVVSVFNKQTEFLDEPNEDEMVELLFEDMKTAIRRSFQM